MPLPVLFGRRIVAAFGWAAVAGSLFFGLLLTVVGIWVRVGPLEEPNGPEQVGVVHAVGRQGRNPLGGSFVWGHVRITATQGRQVDTLADGTLGSPSAQLLTESGETVTVTLPDPYSDGHGFAQHERFERFEDIPSPPLNVQAHVGADRYDVYVYAISEGDPVILYRRGSQQDPFIRRGTRLEWEAENERRRELKRTASLGFGGAGIFILGLSAVIAVLMWRRRARAEAVARPSVQAVELPVRGEAFEPTAIDALPAPWRERAVALARGEVPPDHRVYFGRPGPLRRYVLAMMRRLGAASVVGTMLAAVATAALLAAGKEDVVRMLLSVSCMGAMMCILTLGGALPLAVGARRLRAAPGEHCLALGPDGMIEMTRRFGALKMSVTPYHATTDARLLVTRSTNHHLVFGSGLGSRVASDDLEAPAAVILQDLRAVHRALASGAWATADQLGPPARDDSAARPAVLRGAAPSWAAPLIERIEGFDYPQGTLSYHWSRGATRLANEAFLALCSLVLCVTILPVTPVLIWLLFSRGKRAGHFVSFLPGGLLVREESVSFLPWAQIESVEQRGTKVVVLVKEGRLELDGEGYGLDASILEAHLRRPTAT